MQVEVVYGLANKQRIYVLDVDEGTTARQAAELAPVNEDFPDVDVSGSDIGVFGKAVKDDQILLAGDRVEIYRPLIADPKEVRKQRAAAGKRMKKGGGPGRIRKSSALILTRNIRSYRSPVAGWN